VSSLKFPCSTAQRKILEVPVRPRFAAVEIFSVLHVLNLHGPEIWAGQRPCKVWGVHIPIAAAFRIETASARMAGHLPRGSTILISATA
jgi:hypothetical protein